MSSTSLGITDGIPGNALKVDFPEVERMSVLLADQINDHMVNTGQEYDHALVVHRGGAIPGAIVAARLGFIGCEILSVGMSSYALGTTRRAGDGPVIGQMPSPEMLHGKRIITIDEVWESGFSMRFLDGLLQHAGVALNNTAVLHYKPEENQTDLVPDFYIETTDRWIDYFWEKHQRVGQEARVARGMSRVSLVRSD